MKKKDLKKNGYHGNSCCLILATNLLAQVLPETCPENFVKIRSGVWSTDSHTLKMLKNLELIGL